VRRVLAVLALFPFPVAACTGGGSSPDDGRPTVVAAFAPLADAARAVAGADAAVHDLTPPAVEPHDLELEADQVDRIEDADVVVFAGEGFQPAVERALKRSGARRVDLRRFATDPIRRDPHAWLDPTTMQTLAQAIGDALAELDPAHADAYNTRAAAYIDALAAVDEEYRAGLATCARRVIVTTHAAFGYLARRYDLHQESLAGRNPEAEPDPRRIAELADLVRRQGVTTVFTEGGEDERAALALAREAGVGTAVLATLEQPVRGGYIEGMRANLAALRSALGCP
jgi:zinc transport system substrate-binding protein